MTKTATKIRDIDNPGGRAIQALYRVTPPVSWSKYDEDSGEYVERTNDYVIASASNVMFSGPETLLFPATEDGEVASWLDLHGSFRGELDHEQALRNAGYEVIS